VSLLSVTRKLYLPSTGAAAVAPAYDSMWDDTSPADRKAAVWDAHSGTAFATLAPTWTYAMAPFTPKTVLLRQYVLPSYGAIAAQMQAAGSTTPAEQILAPIARMKVSAARVGSALLYGSYHFVTWACAKVVDASGTVRWVIGRSATGQTPSLSGTMAAKEWSVAYVSGSNLLLPASTDHLVLELGFRLDNGAVGGTVVYSPSVEFGDAAAFDLTTGSTLQGNAHAGLAYYVLAGGTSGGPRILRPLAPSMPAKAMKYPEVPDRSSDLLNEIVLG
jgi:hypothetical protein